jgi:ribosomal protein S3
LKGVYFLINGKIGVGGDSKTRGWGFKFGSVQLSSKTRKCSYSMFRVYTKTGVLGAKFVISYE